jgi:hypothetical protein
MPKQWMYVLALVFVIFLVATSPRESGQAANNMAGIFGDFASGVITFLQNLAGGDSTTAPNSDVGSSQPSEFGGINSEDSDIFGESSN